MGVFDLFKGKSNPDKLSKNDISDFFKIDINNIFKYDPVYLHTEINVCGSEVKHYRLYLKEIELGLFGGIEIIETGENEYNIVFEGVNNTLTKELKEFIKFCSDKFGVDSNGYGEIHSLDYTYIDKNLFSRMWDDVWIDNNSSENISMTLFALPKSTENNIE